MNEELYPSRAFTQFIARNQLLADLTGQPVIWFVQRRDGSLRRHETKPCVHDHQSPDQTLDEALFAEVVKLVFNIHQHPELYQPCRDRFAVERVELGVAEDIVCTYKALKQRQCDDLVQRLNSLL